MATMTSSTFHPLLRYVNVRLQQGVPIVDSDVNELDDVRKFELRAFLKWYVGDGVPEGTNGFQITGGLNNDFTIGAGAPTGSGSTELDTALAHTGRIIVDGLDVMITTDLAFSAQPLHASQTGSAALATKLGVPVVPALTAPSTATTLVAYLDVWEHLVTPDDDPNLILPGLGVESCARTKREWVVRVGAAVPVSGSPDFLAGHSYAALAVLNRPAAALIAPSNIVDKRQRRLLLPPAHLIEDTVGVGPVDYRGGVNRPLISLRTAINALLAGQLPTTGEVAVANGVGTDLLGKAVFLDNANGLVIVWQSSQSGTSQAVLARIDLTNPSLTSVPMTPLTSSGVHAAPSALMLPNGDYLVAYQTAASEDPNSDLKLKRGPLASLAGAGEVTIAANPNFAEQRMQAVLAGDFVVFVFDQSGSTDKWVYLRYKHTDNSFPDTTPVQLSAVTNGSRAMHAASAGGLVFLAYHDGTKLTAALLNPVTNTVSSSPQPNGQATEIHVLALSATSAMVFYNSGSGLSLLTFSGSTWTGPVAISGTDANDSQPTAVQDTDGTIWLLSTRRFPDSITHVVVRRRNAASGDWTAPQRLAQTQGNDVFPAAVTVPGQGIWAVWGNDRNGSTNSDLFARRVITAI
ncbi:DUF6519 domain-containing protein [Streptomyces xylophagus]|uniref:DUF6519 domain-containing protein n=1 Tax=Streptomyces xylophagus TaxID=285514 RepID=UPI0005B8FB84|nr:DUF6519 domain-containing protein [Streptomyces xylophagus]